MMIGIVEIDELGLREAFPGNDGFADFNKCWTCTQNTCAVVIDDVTGSRFSDNVDLDRNQGFLIINNDNRTVFLLAIDKKLIGNHPGGIADCAVFDIAQFLFVEFKSNALGNSDESIRDSFEKAISQLEETINIFRNRVPRLFTEREVMCFIVTNHSFPRATATKQNYIYKFFEENQLELSFHTRHFF